MKRVEHLLTIVTEECAEVTKCVTKILRFNAEDHYPDNPLTNNDRFWQEWHDLQAVVEMLVEDGMLVPPGDGEAAANKAAKKTKVEQYLKYSLTRGTLTS